MGRVSEKETEFDDIDSRSSRAKTLLGDIDSRPSTVKGRRSGHDHGPARTDADPEKTYNSHLRKAGRVNFLNSCMSLYCELFFGGFQNSLG